MGIDKVGIDEVGRYHSYYIVVIYTWISLTVSCHVPWLECMIQFLYHLPQLTRSHKLLISPWCHELKFSGSWNIISQYMVHHHCAGKLHMEITNERWQIISSLVHSSLVMHCRNRLKFLMLKVTRRTASYPIAVFLVSLGFIMFKHHDDRLTPFPATLYRIAHH